MLPIIAVVIPEIINACVILYISAIQPINGIIIAYNNLLIILSIDNTVARISDAVSLLI
jgi:hypothetical protein